MARATQNWGAFVLELIGSLVFLWTLTGVSAIAGAGVFSGSAAFWFPLAVGAAVVASVALLLISFSNISAWGSQMHAVKATGVAGVALAALTWPNMMAVSGAILGFLLAYIGIGMASRR